MARRRSTGRPYAGSVRRRLVPHLRALRFEPLEDRRVLAVVVVSNDLDVVNGETLSIASLIANDGGDGISLREAILAANNTLGADEITFDAALSGQTITLGSMEMAINESLTIDARALAANVTIDANQLSRIFDITTFTGDFMLGGLTLTGGKTTAEGFAGRGGAIRSLTTGELKLEQRTVSGNSTGGSSAYGGGIWAGGSVTLTQSTVSGNSTAGDFARGGGIHSGGTVTLTQSTVSGNSTTGFLARGGGISASDGGVTLTQSTVSGNSTGGSYTYGGGISAFGAVTLTESTVSGNSTTGIGARGGGIASFDAVTLTESTVSGNSTTGDFARGGGIWAGAVTLTQSTVSGNSTGGSYTYGGGISAGGAVTLTQSTVTNNHALHATAMGGGVFQQNSASNHPFSISGSIVAGNMPGSGGADLVPDPQSTLTVNYSLIGTGITPTAGGNNVVTNNPELGPLANNGGPTMTHALLAGSPAIDAGDPDFDPDDFDPPLLYDQRGAPFDRVVGGRIDIGASEGVPPVLVVDSTSDVVDDDYSPGNFSLREAVLLANANPGANTIAFDAALSGQTIMLGGTELVITEALTIDATALAANVTIDANQLSRIFNITATTGDFTLGGLTLTGGRTTAGEAGRGGAIRSLTSGELKFEESTVSGNSTTGFGAFGGGIYGFGAVTLIQSTVSGNSTMGDFGFGGGIHTRSAVTLTQSTVSGNSTAGMNAHGGGIFAYDAVTLTQSTVSGNSTADFNSSGGGIWIDGTVTLTQSTVTENRVLHATSRGGGVHQSNSASNHPFSISGSIVAGNTAAGGGADLVPDPDSTLTVNYSLIGVTPPGGNTGIGNITGFDSLLGPLANNGGPTHTHALLAGSPALDAGDPSIGFNPAEYDQRGAPFTRVHGGRIDIGAFESQPMPSLLFGDYNQDGTVDAADYTVWRNTLGNTGLAPFSGADGNGDGDITQADYDVWRANYGNTWPPPGAGSIAAATAAIDEAITLDVQATTQEHSAQNTKAFDEALVSVGSDVVLQFDSAATSSSHVAKFRLPVVERLIRFDAAQIDLLLLVSPVDRATRNEPTDLLRRAAERDFAPDPDVALPGASDAWFAALGRSPS